MSRRLLSRKTWLMMTIILSMACWCCPAAAYELKVEVLIDGYSQLIIQGNTVQWHNINHDAPGFLEGFPPFPTYLTTAHMGRVAWTPDWPGGGFGPHDNLQDSSIYSGLNLPLAPVDQTVKVVSWSVDQIREGQHGVTISQQPSSSNNYKLIVDFDDLEPGGTAWYTVTLAYIPVSSNTYTIYPTADAVVFSASGSANTNFGNDTALIVYLAGGTTALYAQSYFKFDLSAIPASEFITGATLNAYCNYKKAGSTITVQLRPVVDTTWSETGITWNNKPAYGTLITSAAGNTGWEHWTIPSDNLPSTGLVSFMLMTANGGETDYYSKENASNRPYLLVTTNKKPKSKAPAATNLLLLD